MLLLQDPVFSWKPGQRSKPCLLPDFPGWGCWAALVKNVHVWLPSGAGVKLIQWGSPRPVFGASFARGVCGHLQETTSRPLCLWLPCLKLSKISEVSDVWLFFCHPTWGRISSRTFLKTGFWDGQSAILPVRHRSKKAGQGMRGAKRFVEIWGDMRFTWRALREEYGISRHINIPQLSSSARNWSTYLFASSCPSGSTLFAIAYVKATEFCEDVR